MTPTRVFKLEKYELICGARPVDNGSFEPSLVLTQNVWPTRPRTIAMRKGGFPSEDLAIAAARAQGIEWIANYGQR
jgi:hypothetical protein